MLYKLWNDFITSYELITGTGFILVLFLVALFFVCLMKEDRPNIWAMILVPFATIAMALSKAIRKVEENREDKRIYKVFSRMFGIVLCIFIITISGKRILSPVFYEKAENGMHISDDLTMAMEAILSESDSSVGVLVSPGYGEYFDAYSSRFRLAYDEPILQDVSEYKEADREAYTELLKNNPDMRKVANAAKENSCDYIVYVHDDYWPDIPLTSLGYELMGSYGTWDVYRSVTGGDIK